MKFRVEVNGTELRSKREWTPHTRKIVRRIARRRRGKWSRRWLLPLVASGALLAVGSTVFAPLLRIYTSGTGATETIPGGAVLVSVEVWAGGGSGGIGTGSGCSALAGGGGGSGSYGFTQNSTVGLQNGKTFTYTVGPGGAPSTNPGTASSVAAGSVTGWTTISTNPGGGGGSGGGAGSAGGLGSGGVTQNTAGNAGQAGGAGARGGGAGIAGNLSGDGGPYGAGGSGGLAGAGHPGTAGVNGAVVFLYT